MISWVTLFLDLPAASYDAGVEFWCGVTGYSLSESRGADGEFATFVPPQGDAFLRVQRLGTGPERTHVDLHSPDHAALELETSPGGLPWCRVPAGESVRPAPSDWGTHTSLVDQVCLDIPAHLFDEESRWWSELTGWELVQSVVRREFWALQRPPEIPIRFLLQRLESTVDEVRAHLDIACSDLALEVARHQTLGATVLSEMPWWTTMQAPTGSSYCITSRNPSTGTL